VHKFRKEESCGKKKEKSIKRRKDNVLKKKQKQENLERKWKNLAGKSIINPVMFIRNKYHVISPEDFSALEKRRDVLSLVQEPT
jgi:hypothetical protein